MRTKIVQECSISFISFTSDKKITSGRTHKDIENFVELFKDAVKEIKVLRLKPSKELVKYENVSYHQVLRPFHDKTNLYLRTVSYVICQVSLSIKLMLLGSDVNFFHVGGTLLLLPILLLKLLGKKVIFIVVGESVDKHYLIFHDTQVEKVVAKILRTIQNFVLFFLSDSNIFLSRSIAQPYGYANRKTFFTNMNYIDPQKFDKTKPFRERTIDVIFIGGINREKGVKELVDSVPLIIQKNSDIKIRVIGAGPMLQDLKSEVHSKNLNGYIKFLGWVDHSQLSRHLNEAKFFILPSQTDGLPKALLEAMSCGTIPIANCVGGVVDVIEEPKNGFLLPNNEPETIANKIISILKKSDEYEEMSDAAREYVLKSHSFAKIKKKYNLILESVLRNGPHVYSRPK